MGCRQQDGWAHLQVRGQVLQWVRLQEGRGDALHHRQQWVPSGVVLRDHHHLRDHHPPAQPLLLRQFPESL